MSKNVSKPHHKVVKAALKSLNGQGQDFLDTHPLFGQDTDYPKTAAALKDLALQVSNGTISPEDADEKVTDVLDGEMSERDDKGLGNDAFISGAIGMDIAAE